LLTGFAGGAVGAGQCVGHRDGPQLPLRVGVGDRPQIPGQVSFMKNSP